MRVLERSSPEGEGEQDQRPTGRRPEGTCKFSPPLRGLSLLPPDGRGTEWLQYQIGFAESQLQQCRAESRKENLELNGNLTGTVNIRRE